MCGDWCASARTEGVEDLSGWEMVRRRKGRVVSERCGPYPVSRSEVKLWDWGSRLGQYGSRCLQVAVVQQFRGLAREALGERLRIACGNDSPTAFWGEGLEARNMKETVRALKAEGLGVWVVFATDEVKLHRGYACGKVYVGAAWPKRVGAVAWLKAPRHAVALGGRGVQRYLRSLPVLSSCPHSCGVVGAPKKRGFGAGGNQLGAKEASVKGVAAKRAARSTGAIAPAREGGSAGAGVEHDVRAGSGVQANQEREAADVGVVQGEGHGFPMALKGDDGGGSVEGGAVSKIGRAPGGDSVVGGVEPGDGGEGKSGGGSGASCEKEWEGGDRRATVGGDSSDDGAGRIGGGSESARDEGDCGGRIGGVSGGGAAAGAVVRRSKRRRMEKGKMKKRNPAAEALPFQPAVVDPDRCQALECMPVMGNGMMLFNRGVILFTEGRRPMMKNTQDDL